MKNFSLKMFGNGCLFSSDSIGLCFFASADLMRASKVWTSACILHDRYWHVSGDRLGGFGVKNFSQKMFGNGCLFPRDSVGLCFLVMPCCSQGVTLQVTL